ncbi:MAG: hypothetical protein K2W78_08485 [Xanthobacteraceae bacterium]|nr:hypothetical protein [Xanthobacteraceae bacterium]
MLSNEPVLSVKAWQDAVDALNFSTRFVDRQELSTKEVRLKAECLGKPVLMELEDVGFSYVRKTFPETEFPDGVKYVHALRWNKTLEGGLAAYEAAAAYISFVKGLMIDTEEGKLNNSTRAVELAREMSAGMPALQDLFAEIVAKYQGQKKGN